MENDFLLKYNIYGFRAVDKRGKEWDVESPFLIPDDLEFVVLVCGPPDGSVMTCAKIEYKAICCELLDAYGSYRSEFQHDGLIDLTPLYVFGKIEFTCEDERIVSCRIRFGKRIEYPFSLF